MRRGRVRLGSFFTALVYLSAEAGAALGRHHPELVIVDALVDRSEALHGLAAGNLDVALVFEHDFEPQPAPGEVEVFPLFDDPVRVLLPTGHPLCDREALTVKHLASSPRSCSRDTATSRSRRRRWSPPARASP